MANHGETSWDIDLDEQLLQDLYSWIDQIPLSRPKKRIERDFSDGVMVGELVKFYFPNWVELHNYAPANNTQQKMINWGLLNRKVFSRFDLNVPENIMRGIAIGKTGLVETFMYNLRIKIDDYLYGMETNTSDPEYRNLFQRGKGQQQQQQFKQTPRQTGQMQVPLYDESFDYQQKVSKISKIQPKNKAQIITPKKSNITNMSNEVVPRLFYEEKEQECIAKEEQIQILNAKIRRLEHLLHLKDVRIQDLSEKTESSKGKATRK